MTVEDPLMGRVIDGDAVRHATPRNLADNTLTVNLCPVQTLGEG